MPTVTDRPAALRKATPLGRGVYVFQATGKVAYLGSILTVVDSNNRDTRLGCQCPQKRVNEVAAKLWDKLDAVDPPVNEVEAARILARWEKAIVQAHGRKAFEDYRDLVTEEAQYCASYAMRDLPDREERVADIGKLWIEKIGKFTRQQWDGWRQPSQRAPR